MLKKDSRLSRKDLKDIFSAKGGSASGGKSKTWGFRGKIISVRVFRNEKQKNRFAFIVSGPKNRGAVLRNLTKRRMSEAAKSFIKTMPAGWDVVFFIKLSERKVPSFVEIKKDIKYVLAQNIF